jgi:hypothetical protein
MSSIRRRQRQSDYLVTVPSVWLEGDSPMPSTHVVKAWVPPANIVFTILFGRERDLSQPDSIVNKLSGKASEVEDSSTSKGPRIEHQRVARNDAPNLGISSGMRRSKFPCSALKRAKRAIDS